MRGLKKNIKANMLAVVVMIMTALPGITVAESITERPSGAEMTADLAFVRPLMLGATVLGAAVFIVSSPFSALGGNFKEAADTLVGTPFRSTFMRCLGCGTKHMIK
jgi:ABC-type molybdate transport system permease subunit